MKRIIKEKPTKRLLISFKIYFDRARMYLGYINFFLLNLVFFNSSGGGAVTQYINEHKLILIPVLFVVYTVGLTFIGYLDTKLGFRQEEMRNNAMNNPVMQDLLKTVKEIQKDLRNNHESSSTIKQENVNQLRT